MRGEKKKNGIRNERRKQNELIYSTGGNSCLWVVFGSCQYHAFYGIANPKHNTNNKRVRNTKLKHDPISNRVTRLDTYNPFINLVIYNNKNYN